MKVAWLTFFAAYFVTMTISKGLLLTIINNVFLPFKQIEDNLEKAKDLTAHAVLDNE